MAFFRKLKKHKAILFILIISCLIRLWNIEKLTTFSGDQGYDFLIVKKILEGDLILLGPKIGPYNEIGNLYLGPAYYYLIAPFLYIFKLDPIGPAIETAIFAIATVFFIYLLCLRFFSKKIAILASGLYATNSFLIDQSRAASNPHFIPFFASVFLLSSLMQIKKSNSIIWPITSGVSLGIIFQLHYLGISLLIPLIFMLVCRSLFKSLILSATFFIIAISGQIVFELKHNFFVTKIFINQLSSRKSLAGPETFFDNLANSASQLNQIILQNKFLLPIAFLCLCFLIAIKIYKNKKNKLPLVFLILTILASVLLTSFYSGKIEPHYFAPVYPSLIMLLAIAITALVSFSKNFAYRVLVALITFSIFLINVPTLNLNRENGYTMPEGLNLKVIRNASRIISIDSKNSPKFNIASTLDGDTRAMPYRYLVEVYGGKPQSVENYPTSSFSMESSEDPFSTT